jgi:membrane protein
MARGRARLAEVLQRAGTVLEETVRRYFDDRGPQLAAAIAYYGLFAVFPLTILLVALFGLFAGGSEIRDEVVDVVVDNVPLREEGGRRELESILRDVTSNAEAFGVIGIAGLAFSASGLMGALRMALSRAYDVEERRPPLIGKLLDIALVLAVGAVVGLSLALTVVQRFAVSLATEIEEAIGSALSLLPRVALALGHLTPVVLAAAVFAFLYRYVPAADVRWRHSLPAALAAAGVYEVVKSAFSIYLRDAASYGAVYGSLATTIAFAFFVFLSANVFVLGAELSAALGRAAAGELQPGPSRPLRERLRGLVRTATGL